MLTVGTVTLTDQVYEVAVPTLPTVSVARTWKVCEPEARSL